jgi:hypothetical protein
MVFISQPHPVANDNHWEVESCAAKIIVMAVCQTSSSFRELQVLAPCNGGLERWSGALLSIRPAQGASFNRVTANASSVGIRSLNCGQPSPVHGQRVALGVTEVPEQRAARGEQAQHQPPLARTLIALRRWPGASICSVACSIARTRKSPVAGNAADRNIVPLRGRSRMSGYDSDRPPK